MIIRKEIGSEFWDIPIGMEENQKFSDHMKWFISGRSALNYIISDIKNKQEITTAGLPSWCCDSMIIPFIQAGIKVQFYPVWVEKEKGLVQDISGVIGCDCLLVMDYFGYARTIDYSMFSGVLIRDVTHSIFTTEYKDAEYYFGSLRKWAGFWTGGFAWSSQWSQRMVVSEVDEYYVSLRKQAMQEKKQYMEGQLEKKSFLNIFSEAEQYLEEKSVIRNGHIRDIECVKYLDISKLKEVRRNNVRQLLEMVEDYAMFPTLKEEDCPLFVPILVPRGKRNELRAYLIQQEIYCPIHWLITKWHQLTNQTRKLYEEELSIVCDQRYTEKDMERVGYAIQKFMGE